MPKWTENWFSKLAIASAHCGDQAYKADSGQAKVKSASFSQGLVTLDCTQSLSLLVHINWETGASERHSLFPFSARPSAFLGSSLARGRTSRSLQSLNYWEKRKGNRTALKHHLRTAPLSACLALFSSGSSELQGITSASVYLDRQHWSKDQTCGGGNAAQNERSRNHVNLLLHIFMGPDLRDVQKIARLKTHEKLFGTTSVHIFSS